MKQAHLKAAPQCQSGTRHKKHLHHNLTIADVIRDRALAADYTVIAAMLRNPDWFEPFIGRVVPGDWIDPRHRRLAHFALHDLRSIGIVDTRRLRRLLMGSAVYNSTAWRLDMHTVHLLASMISDSTIVRDAVTDLTHHRSGVCA